MLPGGESFEDPGATAKDSSGGNADVVVSGEVDVDTVGLYRLSYNAMDGSGRRAYTLHREVVVLQANTPYIELLGEPSLVHEAAQGYEDAGAVAYDLIDGPLPVLLKARSMCIRPAPMCWSIRH